MNCISVLARYVCAVKGIRFQHYSSKQIMKIMGNNKIFCFPENKQKNEKLFSNYDGSGYRTFIYFM